MSTQNVLITGISGQDGLFLTDYLLSNKLSSFKVFGVSRQNSEATLRNLKTLNKETAEVEIYNTDLTNTTEVFNLINRIKPSQIYNLSGPSSVYDSLTNQKYFQETINLIFDNLANSCIKQNHFPAFFQACSSEMFSIKNTMPLNEGSTFEPRSPYASAKYEVFNKVNSLKEQFDWNIKSGIMFNHESEFRNKDFLFMQIFNSAKKIKNKELKFLELGSTNLVRDWSFAGDVARAIFLINQSDNNNNFIIGSGVPTSISEIVQKVFSLYDLKPENHIKINPKLLREGDPLEIISDPSLLNSELNWNPQLSVDDLLERMFQKVG
jgi:GDPmannose 4,6-dehydratase